MLAQLRQRFAKQVEDAVFQLCRCQLIVGCQLVDLIVGRLGVLGKERQQLTITDFILASDYRQQFFT
ncbi:hypothetical protein D9M68_988570 [compost metagenome]